MERQASVRRLLGWRPAGPLVGRGEAVVRRASTDGRPCMMQFDGGVTTLVVGGRLDRWPRRSRGWWSWMPRRPGHSPARRRPDRLRSWGRPEALRPSGRGWRPAAAVPTGRRRRRGSARRAPRGCSRHRRGEPPAGRSKARQWTTPPEYRSQRSGGSLSAQLSASSGQAFLTAVIDHPQLRGGNGRLANLEQPAVKGVLDIGGSHIGRIAPHLPETRLHRVVVEGIDVTIEFRGPWPDCPLVPHSRVVRLDLVDVV